MKSKKEEERKRESKQASSLNPISDLMNSNLQGRGWANLIFISAPKLPL